jgi:hypothetical protein
MSTGYLRALLMMFSSFSYADHSPPSYRSSRHPILSMSNGVLHPIQGMQISMSLLNSLAQPLRKSGPGNMTRWFFGDEHWLLGTKGSISSVKLTSQGTAFEDMQSPAYLLIYGQCKASLIFRVNALIHPCGVTRFCLQGCNLQALFQLLCFFIGNFLHISCSIPRMKNYVDIHTQDYESVNLRKAFGTCILSS